VVRKSIKGGMNNVSKKPLLINTEDEEKGLLAEADNVTDITALLTSPRAKPLVPIRTGTIKQVLSMKGGDDKLALKQKQETLKQEMLDKEKRQRDLEDKRMRDEQDLKGKLGDDSAKNVIYAKYQMDKRLKVEREVDLPPATLFLGLGFDPVANAGERHYRRFYPKELELVKEVMP
jgi:hypothetical protein